MCCHVIMADASLLIDAEGLGFNLTTAGRLEYRIKAVISTVATTLAAALYVDVYLAPLNGIEMALVGPATPAAGLDRQAATGSPDKENSSVVTASPSQVQPAMYSS